MIGLYLEEIEAGRVVDLGSHHFTKEAIIAFAKQYDPQPFHLDEEAARNGPLGVLSASGWHTAAGWMKCYVATNQAAEAKIRAEGREPAPIGPVARLHQPALAEARDAGRHHHLPLDGHRQSASSTRGPGWGLVFSLNEGFNQKGELVFSFEGKVLTPKRPLA